ncbi:hypothetical protein V1498_10750 [Peribacillus sp. SCS-26]|uniref:hypothetical protein n=1 Tax=Paraperibacillus marinus TaxID=3115295 RepID=UPI0039065BF1
MTTRTVTIMTIVSVKGILRRVSREFQSKVPAETITMTPARAAIGIWMTKILVEDDKEHKESRVGIPEW